ncbi:MAG: hypothetical protein P8Y63_14290, partial [Deltaproteobacteria bacterium]
MGEFTMTAFGGQAWLLPTRRSLPRHARGESLSKLGSSSQLRTGKITIRRIEPRSNLIWKNAQQSLAPSSPHLAFTFSRVRNPRISFSQLT